MTFFWCLNLGTLCVLNCIRGKKKSVGEGFGASQCGEKGDLFQRMS